jgi:DNA-binding MarR family transcriptional regulator
MAISSASTPGTAARTAATAAIAELESAVAGVVRWSESRHTRAEVDRRAGSSLAPALLRLLEHFEVAGPMRIKDIAECMAVDISTASLQLRELKREELVIRTSDPKDARSGVITITPKGLHLLQRVRAARQELLAEIFLAQPPDRVLQAASVLGLVQQYVLAAMAESGYIVDVPAAAVGRAGQRALDTAPTGGRVTER